MRLGLSPMRTVLGTGGLGVEAGQGLVGPFTPTFSWRSSCSLPSQARGWAVAGPACIPSADSLRRESGC